MHVRMYWPPLYWVEFPPPAPISHPCSCECRHIGSLWTENRTWSRDLTLTLSYSIRSPCPGSSPQAYQWPGSRKGLCWGRRDTGWLNWDRFQIVKRRNWIITEAAGMKLTWAGVLSPAAPRDVHHPVRVSLALAWTPLSGGRSVMVRLLEQVMQHVVHLIPRGVNSSVCGGEAVALERRIS